MDSISSETHFYHQLEKSLGKSCVDSVVYIPYESYCENITSSKFKVYEDWWVAKPGVVVSKIRALLGESDRVFARKTKVLKIDKPTCDAFLEENHIYGATKAKHKIGLFYQDDLVAVATFAAQRNLTIGRSVELIRFCSKNGTTIVGGLDKLLTFYIKEYAPDHIMTYIDKDWGSGKGFLNLGFHLTTEKQPINYCVNPKTGKRRPIDKKTIDCELSINNSGSLKLEKKV